MAMTKRWTLAVALTVAAGGALIFSGPATAVTESPMRKTLESNQFSEFLIRSSIYSKSSHDVYHRDSRKWEHGLPRVTRPTIYEPDVYTWELAMAAHRRQLAAMIPPPAPMPLPVSPAQMAPPMMVPPAPGQVQLTPLGPDGGYRELPANADSRMESLLSRAHQGGMGPDGQLRAESIKQRLIDHMNSLSAPTTPAGGPNVPVLPQNLPRGKGADSYDQSYDRADEGQ